MSLTNGEASAINTLVHRVTDTPDAMGNKPTDEQVRVAATLLVGSAYKKLMAGIRPAQLDELFAAPAEASETKCDHCEAKYDEARGDGYAGLCPECADDPTIEPAA